MSVGVLSELASNWQVRSELGEHADNRSDSHFPLDANGYACEFQQIEYCFSVLGDDKLSGAETMELAIRKAKREDAIAAWDIRKAAIRARCTGHYPEEDLAAWTAGEITDDFVQSVAQNWYVAILNESVVGIGTLDFASGRVDAIFVRPDTMGRGVGSAMMAYLESRAIELRLTQLTLDSTLNAAPLYRKCGFVGEQISVYQSPRGISLACIPMTKQLVAPTIARESSAKGQTSAMSVPPSPSIPPSP